MDEVAALIQVRIAGKPIELILDIDPLILALLVILASISNFN